MTRLEQQARVVIIGGGIIGCSVAYHLARKGWQDVVLLERRQLSCGTTWHAAGLIGQLRNSANMTRLAKYSAELYRGLEAETGLATGLRTVGSISVALSGAREEELRRLASMARAFGVPVDDISPAEIKARYPHINLEGVRSGVWLPTDGQGDPANIALALARGATQHGAKVLENTEVTAVDVVGRRAGAVHWCDAQGERGLIEAEQIVNCGGMWAHQLGRMVGVNVPLHACEHFYIVTDAIEGLEQMPVLRVPDECAYYKEDAGRYLLGAFEAEAKPWGMDGIPEDFCFDQLPEDFDHFEPILERAMHRLPLLADAGIHTFFNGPESFTPDDAYNLGLAPELDNYWVAAGFNSIGIQSAGGAGMALAEWMDSGEKPFDLGDVDISRYHPFQGNRIYLRERARESLGLLYADHFPYRQKATARGVRRTPFHERLAAQGAVFGELAGWERANWFADAGQTREYAYAWGRQNWFANQAAEHRAVREGVGLYDMSSFGKIRVEGPDAERFLDRVCGANLKVPPGRIVYTQFLNSRGGIEADVTVTRLSDEVYLVVTPALTLTADMAWLRRHRQDQERVVLIDMTTAEGVLAVMGPKSRQLLEAVSPNDFGNEHNPFSTAQSIEIGMGLARAHRISYVGELGWEIYVSCDMATHVFDFLIEAGADTGLKLCGMHMMDSCRIEKGFRHFGHDISSEDHVLEAGLGFAVDTGKASFIGRDAVLSRRESGLLQRMLQFRLNSAEPMLYHHEPILRDGEYVGYISSGAYGHHLGGAIGLGYVPCAGESPESLLASSYAIEVAGERIAAEASIKPLYDPRHERMRA